MKIAKLFFKVAPYLFRNHLFVSPLRVTQLNPTLDSEYIIKFPADLSYITNNELLDIDTNWKSLNDANKLGNLFCFVTWRGQLVHRSIIQTKGIVQMEGDRRAFNLATDEFYIHSCYTQSNHRGKGLYTAVLHYILTTYSISENPAKIFIACRQENSSSIHGIQRAGFIYLKSSMIIGILSGMLRIRCWYSKSDMAPGNIEFSSNVNSGNREKAQDK